MTTFGVILGFVIIGWAVYRAIAEAKDDAIDTVAPAKTAYVPPSYATPHQPATTSTTAQLMGRYYRAKLERQTEAIYEVMGKGDK